MALRSWRPVWDDAAIEAAAADCIVVGNRAGLWNLAIVIPQLDIRSLDGAWALVDWIMEDEKLQASLLEEQQRRVRWYAFDRPLKQLGSVLERFESRFGRGLARLGRIHDQDGH